MNPTALDPLPAIEAIRQLKARYCRFVDTKQWERLKALFAPDAQFDGFGSVPDGTDPATFVSAISKRLAQAITVHHVHAPEIVFLEPQRARGVWAMMDYVDFQAGGQAKGTGAGRGWIGWGYYEEEYACLDGVWLISYMRLTRQRMDELTADHPEAKFSRHGPATDWL